MLRTKNIFMYNLDDEIGGGDNDPTNGDNKTTDEETAGDKKEGKDKSFTEKVHDALQQWSNDDQRDQEIDDRTP